MYGLAFTIWFGSAIVMRSGWIVIRASRSKGGGPVDRRARIPSGPDIEGVIGTAKVFYDVWGDTVNTASWMEFHGEPGRIQVTEASRALLQEHFEFSPRGPVEIKGIGEIETWWLEGGLPLEASSAR